MIDLEGELGRALGALTLGHRRALVDAGIPNSMMLFMVGVQHVAVAGDRYEPSDGGAFAFVTPVRVADATLDLIDDIDHLSAPSFGDLIDLVAWHPDTPSRWATRLGNATFLGAVPPQLEGASPVRIRRTPLAWLRAGAAGLAVLSRNRLHAQRVLLQCRQLEAEDDDHRRTIEALLRTPARIPPVYARRRARRAAA